jgi:His-Xaa-Ser system radical SAM maturase HxsB
MKQSVPYTILPFRFSRFGINQMLLVNDAGDFYFLDSANFSSFIEYHMVTSSRVFKDLKSKHFATDTHIAPVIDLISTKYRSKKAFLNNFTALHMVVITARCNHRCSYCHASSEDISSIGWDMKPAVGKKVVEMIFQSPSPNIKIEFQGGEPLLNWSTVTEIVSYAQELNKTCKKNLEFVLCSNITMINEDHIKFIKDNNILISTSLDGPKDIHDAHRIMRNGKSSYDSFVEKLHFVRKYLGQGSVSALMTITPDSLKYMREIIDEYIKLGFSGVFIRALNPFGYAKLSYDQFRYSTTDFVNAYEDALSYVIDLNIRGTYFEDFFTTLLLTRILTPFSTGFVDLQSPTGAGICGVIYNQNGEVYPCDEARMLAKMGDKKFLLGNVMNNSYAEIFLGKTLRNIIANSCVETLPGCSSCVFQIYCGADPIRNYAEQGDIIGHRPTGNFCKKHKAIFENLFNLIREDKEEVMDVFWSWITKRPVGIMKHVELSGQTSKH